MNTFDPVAVVADNLPKIRALMYRGGTTRDSCINAARILHDVFNSLNVRHQIRPYEVQVYNPALMQYLAEHDGNIGGLTRENMDEFGGWILGVAPHAPRYEISDLRGINFHIVVTAGDLLFDLSADQFSRPAKNMHVEPFAIPFAEFEIRAFKNDVRAGMIEMNGCGLFYRSMPENTLMKARVFQSPSWKNPHNGFVSAQTLLLIENRRNMAAKVQIR